MSFGMDLDSEAIAYDAVLLDYVLVPDRSQPCADLVEMLRCEHCHVCTKL